jgi:anti-anti-sigma factor
MFGYTLRDEHSIKCIIAKGRIDALSSQEIQNIFDELILAGERILLVDMTFVNYVSSAGLRIFISTQKELKKVQGEIILCAFEIFRMSGLTKIFRIIANTGEVPELLRKDRVERKIITRDIGDISFEYIEEKANKGVLFAVGSQDKLVDSAYTKEDVIAVKPAEMQFGCGLAALGHAYDEFKDLFGESMTVNNNFFFYPAVKHPSVDFVLNVHRDPGITYKLFHGFGFSGSYRYVLSFQSKNISTDLSSLIEGFFDITDANMIGLSFLAKSKGLWGMHIKQTPIAEHKPEKGRNIFDSENFSDWIDFPVEPAYVNHVVVGTGIAVRDRRFLDHEKLTLFSGESAFHIHGGIFDKAPFRNNASEYDNEIMRVFNELSLFKIQHILGQSRFSEGMAAIIEIEN